VTAKRQGPPPVDLRARLPKWLDEELRLRAARREMSKSGYMRSLLLADVRSNPTERAQ
jgi:hypothetical protein